MKWENSQNDMNILPISITNGECARIQKTRLPIIKHQLGVWCLKCFISAKDSASSKKTLSKINWCTRFNHYKKDKRSKHILRALESSLLFFFSFILLLLFVSLPTFGLLAKRVREFNQIRTDENEFSFLFHTVLRFVPCTDAHRVKANVKEK